MIEIIWWQKYVIFHCLHYLHKCLKQESEECTSEKLHLERVLGPGLDPLGHGGNRADPRKQVLQVGSCIQNLVVSSHPVNEIHKLLEVQVRPSESISHKELASVPVEVSLQLEQALWHSLAEHLLQGGVSSSRVFGIVGRVLQI